MTNVAPHEKFAGGYLPTGDLGAIDEEGYIRYAGCDDDVITSAGYRIGPDTHPNACAPLALFRATSEIALFFKSLASHPHTYPQA